MVEKHNHINLGMVTSCFDIELGVLDDGVEGTKTAGEIVESGR